MKNLSTRIPAFILSFLVVIFITAFIAQQARATDNEANDFIEEVVNKAKQTLPSPQKFGEILVLTDIYAQDNNIGYTFEVALDSAEFPVEQLDAIADGSAHTTFCDNEVTPYFQKYDAALIFNLKFSNEVITLNRKAADCPFAE